MESIIADEMVRYFTSLQIISNLQHGFRRGRSCLTNLLLARDSWTRAADEGVPVDVSYLDFSKAFDRVNHPALLRKLAAYGIHGSLLTWLESYLYDRRIEVRIANTHSDSLCVTGGVPQGSVLGPLLFLVYINDLPANVQSPMQIFADDAKMWRAIQSTSDPVYLQDDLNRIHEWAVNNQLPLNPEKCHLLSLRSNCSNTYHLGQRVIKQVSNERDLGVIVQEGLGNSLQCSKAANIANLNLRLLRRALGTFERQLVPLLINAYIRPHLEYAVQAWRPWLKRDIRLLEQPQRRATKATRGLSGLSYELRLRSIGLYSLEYRRLRSDLILTYRILREEDHPLMPYFRHYSNRHSTHPVTFSYNQLGGWKPNHNSHDKVINRPEDLFLSEERELLDTPTDAAVNILSHHPLTNVDMATYYPDWHHFLHGDGNQRCLPIPQDMLLCQHVGYKRMILPNFLQHEDYKEVVDESQVWVSLAHTECHADLKKFLCALYAPVCLEEYQERMIAPCSDLCEEVRQQCLPKMLQFGFGWPDIVECSRFPRSSSKMCIPLTNKTSPQCAGCVDMPNYESVVSSFCTSDIALRARLSNTAINRSNISRAASYQIRLAGKVKILKFKSPIRPLWSLNIEIKCECIALKKAFASDGVRPGKWILMGKLSIDQKSLEVGYLSLLRKPETGMRRALQAIRRRNTSLCHLPKSTARARMNSKILTNVTDSTKRKYLGDSAALQHILSGPNPAYKTGLLQESVGPVIAAKAKTRYTKPSLMRSSNRRALIKRSQNYYPRVEFTTDLHLGVGNAVKKSLGKAKFPTTGKSLQLRKHVNRKKQIDGNLLLLEYERDLFSPQNMVPWL
ncbi:unnamed protein product [Dicrocoelium dendriticum]|nr:unnamed protein product [Dicrocoelium dendriticum]